MKHLLYLALPFVIFASSCNRYNTSVDAKQSAATESMIAEAERQIGMPGIVNFTERKFAKMILELRDEEIKTFTYIVDMHGKRHFLCESIGYGIPYSTQYTNPVKIARHGPGGYAIINQPDPNGLFMPTSSSATWVISSTENGPKPIYVESEILVSPYRLEE